MNTDYKFTVSAELANKFMDELKKEMNKIIVGSTVKLKSGSVLMTVDSIHSNGKESGHSAWCKWYDFNNSEVKQECIDTRALVLSQNK